MATAESHRAVEAVFRIEQARLIAAASEELAASTSEIAARSS